MRKTPIRIGCAGWAIPRSVKRHFPAEGTALERYASVFSCAEINSSFYKEHKPETYARWARSVPASFRFSVKIPKAISHERRLEGVKDHLSQFLDVVGALGKKLGVLLLQLPPGFEFDARIAKSFFRLLRRKHEGAVVLEPRHPTWFNAEAVALAAANDVAHVTADPVPKGCDALTQHETRIAYFRLHGSPRMYFSPYSSARLAKLAAQLSEVAAKNDPVWCIFDNTGSGAAAANALSLRNMLDRRARQIVSKTT